MTRTKHLKWAVAAAALGANVFVQAQIAQDPLLSRTAAVEPNIVFIFDDSASMQSTAIYQYGTGTGSGFQGYQGNHGPNNDADCLAITSSTCVWISTPPPSPYGRSPDVNLIYYDPRVTYKRRINADGTYKAAGSTSGITSFNVYFYKPPTVARYAVNSVGVTSGGSGFPSNVTASFTPAPLAGGTAATATVQTSLRYTVGGVTVTNGGYGYPNTVGAVFTAAPTGGTTATATVQTADVLAVNTATPFNYVSRGTGLPATGLTAVFNSPGTNGVQATVASVTTQATSMVQSITILTGGSCASGATATVSTPGSAGGVRATVTVNRSTTGGTNRPVTSFTITNQGSGYTLPPTLTFSGCTTAPTYTAILGTTYMVDTVTVGNPGAGYPSGSPPTLTFGGASATALGTINVTTNTVATKTITGITVTNAGSGYTSAPTLNLTATGTGNAAWTLNTPSSYTITGITVTNPGSGYGTQPTLQLANTGGGGGQSFSYSYATTILSGGANAKWDGTLNPNGLAAGKGPVNTGDYYTPSYTPDATSPLAAGADPTVAYPNTANAFTATSKYPKFRDRTDCVQSTQYCTGVEELQNYANWKAYHSTRADLAVTGIGLAFQPLNPTFRLGWGTLGGISGLGSTSGQCGSSGTAQLAKGVRRYDSTTQADFLAWLDTLAARNSSNQLANVGVLCTPSRYALNNVGTYFLRKDDAGPWGPSPAGNGSLSATGAAVTTHATCRRSYAMLMTDGYYNDSFTTVQDTDSTAVTVTSTPQTYQYTPTGPYSDNTVSGTKVTSTLADVAMKYWLTDLRDDLSNSVKAVTGDPAYWQHLSFYAVGLGLIGTLDATSPTVLQSLTGNSPSRTLNWPTPPAGGDDVRTIDDMWHATLNGRGKLLNAKTAAELNSSIQQMMSDISGKEGTQSGVAVSAPSLTKDTRKYTPTYTPITWTGNITAYLLNQTNANQSGTAWEVEKLVATDPVTGAKTYSSKIPAAASRNIYVGNGATTGATRAVPFTYSGMGSTLLAQMGSSTVVTQQLVDFLRGDPTNEDTDTSGMSPTGIYRPRQTRLGDVVNSTPVFVKNSVDLGYEQLPTSVTGQSTYRTFVTAKNARTEGVLFVGANDGMLHAFRDGTYDASGNPATPGGAEVFAYVPNALLPSLSKLADKTYTHQYYVDGPNSETDAYLSGKGAWANIVLGSTGAGAGVPSSAGTSPQTAVFAIDTTSLNTSVTGMDASNVLWEVSSKNTGFAELGYVLTDIQAGITAGGQWVAVFGNGYESKSCQARLFVVNLETGALIREINTGAGSCTTAGKNGLGGVRLVKNSNQQVIGAYAGDLLGNLWKFDLSNTNASNWGVDLGGQPLFKTSGQPITAAPTAISLPLVGAANPRTGYMVVVGTGKFYEVADITSTGQQSLYGIWDKAAFGASSTTGVPLTDTTQLVQQTIGSDQLGTNGNTYATISTNAVDYTGSTPKRGWFINLPKTGQRNVYPIDLLANRFALADTISPNNVSLDPCNSTNGGSGFQYIFDALTGAGPTQAILDTNGDGNINSSDLIVSGVAGVADGRNVSIIVSKNDLAITYANVGGGSPGANLIKIACELTGTCKAPVVNNFKHQVRQLFLR